MHVVRSTAERVGVLVPMQVQKMRPPTAGLPSSVRQVFGQSQVQRNEELLNEERQAHDRHDRVAPRLPSRGRRRAHVVSVLHSGPA